MAISETTESKPNHAVISAAARPVICQVLHSLTVGGAEVLASRLARRLNEQYRFVFAVLDDIGELGEELVSEGYVVEKLGRRAGWDLQCARRLQRFLKNQKVDVVHAHQYTPFFYSMLAGLFGRRPRVLFNEHGRFHPDLPSRKRILFNRAMLRRQDHVVAVGRQVRRALVQNEGLPETRIDVIYNGVRLSDFDSLRQQRESLRHELNLAPDDVCVLQVARLDYLKDHSTALRTIERLERDLPHVRLLLAGEGPERAKIEHEVRQRKLENHVQLLGMRRDVPRLLAAADVFLLTSISEGIPVTLIEAMCARLPVVSTDVGGVGEVIEHEQSGLLAPAGDDQQLAECIQRVLSDDSLRDSMVEAAVQTAVTTFSEQTMHQSYADLYQRMLYGNSSQ